MKQFLSSVSAGAEKFRQWLDKEKVFKVYSHFDADGISSAAVMASFLKSKGRIFSVTIVEQLSEDIIKGIPLEGEPLILLDFGSGKLKSILKIAEKRKVLILDHHQPQGKVKSDNLIHINPCLHDLDGGSEISASGVTYLFAREIMGPDPFLASISLIGARGDLISVETPLNSMILKESSLVARKDLKIYGLNSRPIHKALEYTDKDFIPGVSGDETACVNFLNEIGIKIKKGEEWRTINDLSSEEKQKLVSAIIVRRRELDKPEDIFMDTYELKVGKRRTLNEWAALLNACGRMKLPSLGMSALLNPDYEKKVSVVLEEYSKIIGEGLKWLEENKGNSDLIKETSSAFYFLGGEDINPHIVGTLCSIKAPEIGKKFIVGFASKDDVTKVSIRRINSDLKASDLAVISSEGIGEGGGHAQAAGAFIKKGSEEIFIKNFEKALKMKGV